jgi:hypothetical protein
MLTDDLPIVLSRPGGEVREAASRKDADSLRDAVNAEEGAQKQTEEARSVKGAGNAGGGAFDTERTRIAPKARRKKEGRQEKKRREERLFRDPSLGGNVDVRG